jgi:hypothetical protein
MDLVSVLVYFLMNYSDYVVGVNYMDYERW